MTVHEYHPLVHLLIDENPMVNMDVIIFVLDELWEEYHIDHVGNQFLCILHLFRRVDYVQSLFLDQNFDRQDHLGEIDQHKRDDYRIIRNWMFHRLESKVVGRLFNEEKLGFGLRLEGFQNQFLMNGCIEWFQEKFYSYVNQYPKQRFLFRR